MEDKYILKENIYTKECIRCGSIFIGNGNDWFGICPDCKNIKEDKEPQKQCLYCMKYYTSDSDDKGEYKYFGVCPECRKEPKLGCTCDNCGCKISYQQWLNNIRHLCSDCLDDIEEE